MAGGGSVGGKKNGVVGFGLIGWLAEERSDEGDGLVRGADGEVNLWQAV